MRYNGNMGRRRVVRLAPIAKQPRPPQQRKRVLPTLTTQPKRRKVGPIVAKFNEPLRDVCPVSIGASPSPGPGADAAQASVRFGGYPVKCVSSTAANYFPPREPCVILSREGTELMATLHDGKHTRVFKNADALANELSQSPPPLSLVSWGDFIYSIEKDLALVGLFVKFVWASSVAPRKLQQMNTAVSSAQKLFTSRSPPKLGGMSTLDAHAIRPTGGYILPAEALRRCLEQYVARKQVIVPYKSMVNRYKRSDFYWTTGPGKKELDKDARIPGGLNEARPKLSQLHASVLKLGASYGPDAFEVDAVAALEHPTLRSLLLKSKRGNDQSGVVLRRGRLVVPYTAIAGFEISLLFHYLASAPEVFDQAASRNHWSSKYERSPLHHALLQYDHASTRKIETWGDNKVVPACAEILRKKEHLDHEDRKMLARAIGSGLYPIEATKISTDRGQRREVASYAAKFAINNDYEKSCTKACRKYCPYGLQREACLYNTTGHKIPFGSADGFSMTKMGQLMSRLGVKPKIEYARDPDFGFDNEKK